IQYGKGKDRSYDLERIAAEVAGADVIALQEVERYWTRSGNIDQVAVLAQLLDCYHWVYGPGVDIDGSYRDADGRLCNRRRQFGNMLLAKPPIAMSRNHLLPKYASYGPLSIQRSALEGLLYIGDRALRVYSIHLTHLSPETRFPQVEKLWEIHRQAPVEGAALTGEALPEWTEDPWPRPELPHEAILMGDFNFRPDSREYRRMVGPSGDYGGLLSNPEGFVDAWVQSGHPQAAGATCEVLGKPARIDYFFVSARLRERIGGVRIDAAAQGSDHQPVWLDIEL
ncbi:MAG: endonuclease/exonuclease/phosphatase family protein, partial [Gammaproteobacteria bacterium]|nr:endonuclease/exonuclease/phosphatase family protein [Gammaproteobacteria bacterium]